MLYEIEKSGFLYPPYYYYFLIKETCLKKLCTSINQGQSRLGVVGT